MKPIDEVVVQINVSPPEAITREALLAAVKAPQMAAQRWRSHLRTLVGEVPAETLHLCVLDGDFTFGELAAIVGGFSGQDGQNDDWIREMARLELARDVGRHSSGA